MNDILSLINGMLGADNLVSLLLLLMLVSVFANLALIHKESRRKNKKIGNDKLAKILLDFYNDQISQTQNTSRHQKRKNFKKKVMRLRQAYLAIERGVLVKGINSDDYWLALHENLESLLAIYEKHKTNKILTEIYEKIKFIKKLLDNVADLDKKENTLNALKKLEEACEVSSENPIRLNRINIKLGNLIDKFCNEYYRQSAHLADAGEGYIEKSQSSLGKIKDNTSVIQEIIEASDGEGKYGDSMSSLSISNDNMREKILLLEDQLKSSKEKLKNSADINESAEGGKQLEKLNTEIRDISDEIIYESEREIARLNGLVKEKKSKIQEREVALMLTQNGEEKEGGGSKIEGNLKTTREQEVDLLRKNLFESEQCILLLEKELEVFKESREQIDQLNSELITDKEIERLNDAIDRFKKDVLEYETAWREKSLLVSYLQECLDAQTIEDMALSIYQFLVDTGMQSDILVYGNSRTLEVNAKGALAKKDKILLNNLQIGEVNLSHGGKNFYCRLRNVGGLVRHTEFKEISRNEHENLLEFFQLTDKLVWRIKMSSSRAKQRKSQDDIENSMKYFIKEMDESFETIFKNMDKAIRDNFGQLQNIAKSAGINATFVSSIKNMEKNVAEELVADKRIKLQLHKGMLKLLQKVEDMG